MNHPKCKEMSVSRYSWVHTGNSVPRICGIVRLPRHRSYLRDVGDSCNATWLREVTAWATPDIKASVNRRTY